MTSRFSILPAAAVDDTRLTGAEFRMLAILGTYLDKDNTCFPSLATLGARCGSEPTAVSRRIKRLCQLGYVVKTARVRENGGTSSNSYRVIIDPTTGDGPDVPGGVVGADQGMLTTPLEDHHLNKKEPPLKVPAENEGETGALAPITASGSDVRRRKIASEFDQFWKIYPCKQGKKPAFQKYEMARRKHDVQTIASGLRLYMDTKPPDRSWLHASTFLHQERFLDEPEPALMPAPRVRQETILEKFQRESDERATESYRRACENAGPNGAAPQLPNGSWAG